MLQIGPDVIRELLGRGEHRIEAALDHVAIAEFGNFVKGEDVVAFQASAKLKALTRDSGQLGRSARVCESLLRVVSGRSLNISPWLIGAWSFPFPQCQRAEIEQVFSNLSNQVIRCCCRKHGALHSQNAFP